MIIGWSHHFGWWKISPRDWCIPISLPSQSATCPHITRVFCLKMTPKSDGMSWFYRHVLKWKWNLGLPKKLAILLISFDPFSIKTTVQRYIDHKHSHKVGIVFFPTRQTMFFGGWRLGHDVNGHSSSSRGNLKNWIKIARNSQKDRHHVSYEQTTIN